MAKVFPALLYFEPLVFLMSLCTYERISRFGLFSALPPFDQGRKSAGRRVAVSDIFCQFYQQWTKIERPENLMDLQESFSLCVCIATAHHSSLLLVRCLLWPWLWLLFFFVIYLNKLADFYFDFSFCFRLFCFCSDLGTAFISSQVGGYYPGLVFMAFLPISHRLQTAGHLLHYCIEQRRKTVKTISQQSALYQIPLLTFNSQDSGAVHPAECIFDTLS